MYELKNGILHKNGEPTLALGISYYASYHHQKVPVPEDGDRVGEMIKDFKDVKNAGFNFIRTAALGKIERTDKGVEVDFPFIDTMMEKANEADLASMIRLQGYSINLCDYKDATMLNEKGEEMPFYWSWFVRNSLNHPGVIKDNEDATIVSAKHFAKYPSLVSYQIYNEPAYPNKGFYDYNPHSIKAYKKWLAEKGYKSAAEAELTEPPRQRPEKGQDANEWILWRQFCMEKLNWYLCHLGDKAKEGYIKAEVTTCHMTCPMLPGNAIRGQDYFQTAEGMDMLGITHYIATVGPNYYTATMVFDCAESAAATFGKNFWLVEADAHTMVPATEWERLNYSVIGSAAKGILYYQWRADYPYSDAPEPEGFGLVYNDGTKTEKYDVAIKMNALINHYSKYFACSEKVRSGVAVLFSNHATEYFDAIDNGGSQEFSKNHDRYSLYMRGIYYDFRDAGAAVDYTRACDLERNPLGIKLLLISSIEGLSEEELADIDKFIAAGGTALVYEPAKHGYYPYNYEGNELKKEYALKDSTSKTNFYSALIKRKRDYDLVDARTAMDKYSMKRAVEIQGNAKYLDAKLLKGSIGNEDYRIIALVNYDTLERTIKEGDIRVSLELDMDINGLHALYVTPEKTVELKMEILVGKVSMMLPEITTGAFIFIGKGFKS